MVDMRELRRSESRKRRILEKLGADQREVIKHVRIGNVLNQLKLVVADETFNKFIHTHGVQSIPELFIKQDSFPDTLDRSLAFVVAWRFFSPFLYDPVTAAFLDTRWPGLTLEMRDIFISIVADGPFPHEPRGRDRRTI